MTDQDFTRQLRGERIVEEARRITALHPDLGHVRDVEEACGVRTAWCSARSEV